MQRQTSLQVPLRTCDFIPIQASAHANFNSLAAETQRRVHRLAHRPPEAHPFFQLQRNRLRNQLRVELRLVHFLNVDENVLAGSPLLQLRFQLVDFRAFASDDDPGPRGLDDDAQLVARPLDLDGAHARRLELLLQFRLQLDVLKQLLVVIPLGKPARLPRLGVAQPKTIRMNFLTHCFS